MTWRWMASCAVLLLAAAAGCGSDERATSPSAPDGSEVPFGAGPLTGVTRGAVGRPAVTNSASATITGLAARFTRLEYRESGVGFANMPIYVEVSQDYPYSNHIFRMLVGTGELEQLTFGVLNEFHPSVDPSGTRIAYWEGDPTGSGFSGVARLMIMDADGGNPRSIGVMGRNRHDMPFWTPDGGSVLYRSQDTITGVIRLFRRDVTTGDSTILLSGDQLNEAAVGTVDGIPTAFAGISNAIVRIRLTTGAVDTLFPGSNLGGRPRISPNGRFIVSSGPGLFLGAIADLSHHRPIPIHVGAFDVATAEWLPDNSGFVALVYANDGPYTYQYFVIDTLGHIRRQVTNLGVQFRSEFSLGPAPVVTESRRLLGAGGLLGDSASGILISQTAGGQISTVVAFSSADQESVQLVQQTGLNSSAPALSYWVQGEQLTGMRAVSGPGLDSVTILIDPASTQETNGALVTFDPGTGALALVLLSSSDAASEFQIEDRGTLRIFRGHFLQVLGPDGIDRGSGSAREVTLDLGTHQIRAQR